MRRLVPAFLAALGLLCQGCFGATYVGQAVHGEASILASARPIGTVLTDDVTAGRTRRLLAAVRTIKDFGLEHGLAPTANYRSYADLRRTAAVWVVEACAPLAFDVKRWSFPVVGTIPYLGFFDEQAARAYARTLSSEGLDVDVRTASAFSTLGWFHDPVLSTMLRTDEDALGELANVVLHESVHATLYVRDQSAFDESLASFVADRLTPLWLERAAGADAPDTRMWVTRHRRDRARLDRLHRAYLELDALYRSSESDGGKRAGKARVLDAVREELHLAGTLNNAVLADYKTYGTGTAAFERLLRSCDGSWSRLMKTLRRLGPSDFGGHQREEFDDVIDRLTRQGCDPLPRTP